MKTTHYLKVASSSLLAMLFALFMSAGKILAQHVEKDAAEDEVDWPQHTTLVIGGGLNINMATGPYTIDQNEYNFGHGYGPEFHIGLEFPTSEHFAIAPRINYSSVGGTFTDGMGLAGAQTISNFAYDARTVGLDLLMKFSINRFHVLLGPDIGYLFKKTWAHGEFGDADASTTDLPGVHRILVTAGAGVGYDAPLNHANTVWLTPEITYNYPITNLGAGDKAGVSDPGTVKVGHLKPSTLRGALSFKFDISPTPAPVEIKQMRPLSVTVTAKGLGPNGEVINEPALYQNGTTTRASVPLLPYVFFDDNSAVIPARYPQLGSTGFNESQLAGKDALEINHAVLDIVGSRMKQYPELTVKVTGCNSNTKAERHNISLSRQRAMAIRDYLVNTWGIDGGRITVDARDLPEIPTNPVTPAGIEENRRAEISASKVDDPVQVTDQQVLPGGPTGIRYETTVYNPDNIGVSNWRITLDQNGNVITTETGTGAPPAVVPSHIPDADRYVGQPVHYKLEVTDVNGKVYTADGMTRVDKNVTGDNKYLEKYAMLSFDFDRSVINERAEKMVNVMAESINGDSKSVAINGYCDITGTDDYNQALSERRANAAAEALRASSAHLPEATTVTGHGRNDPKFTNDLPEGRQLNRRVEVDIEKTAPAAVVIPASKKED